MGRGIGQAVTFEDLRAYVTDGTFTQIYNFPETTRKLAKKSEVEARLNVDTISGSANRAVKSQELVSATPVPNMNFTVWARAYYPIGTDIINGTPTPPSGGPSGTYRQCRSFDRIGEFRVDLLFVPEWFTNNVDLQSSQPFINDVSFSKRLRSTVYELTAFPGTVIPTSDSTITTFNFGVGDQTKSISSSLIDLYNCGTYDNATNTLQLLEWGAYSTVVVGESAVGYGTRNDTVKTISLPARFYFLGYEIDYGDPNIPVYINFKDASGTVIPAPVNINFDWNANIDPSIDPANLLNIGGAPVTGSSIILAGQTRTMIISNGTIIGILASSLRTTNVTPGNIGSFKVVDL